MVISPTKNASFKNLIRTSCIYLHSLCFPFYGEVGLDVHKKHVISREDDLHETKEHGINEPVPAYNLPAKICLVSSRTAQTSRSQSHTEQNPLSKEVYVIEEDAAVSAVEKADNVVGTRKFNNLASL
jgi:ATP-dependent DNA helicase HFM1/MER3